jgi:hypothetical protein
MQANVLSYYAPILQRRAADQRNALAQIADQAPTRQQNALAQYGGPTREAANALASPGGDVAAYVRSGLIQRGLPEHVADAFVINFRDESGLDPGINEAAPIVPGSRGGFGLYQVTGPRRRSYEAFAADRGEAYDDIDAQLDFLMTELHGPESRAASRIFETTTTGGAADAILRHFLRPAPEHVRSRSARYLNL